MEKEWYKSKTIWASIIGGVAGVSTAFGYTPPLWFLEILAGFGLYSLRVGKKAIK